MRIRYFRSEPLLILGDDNERYILKNQKVSPQEEYDCMFLNEFISGQIALHLGVPTPEFAIAELDKRILENGPSLRFVHKFTDGVHFASKEVPNVEANLEENYAILMQMKKPYITRSWNKFFEDISNPQDVAKIIAFDLFIANFDRYNNSGNLLIHNDFGKRKVVTIDHGHAFFGPVWNTVKVGNLRSVGLNDEYYDLYVNNYLMLSPKAGYMGGLGEVFRAIERNIELDKITNHSFQMIVHNIESINEPIVDEWFSEVPDVWFKDKKNQIGYYKQYLLQQKDMVRYLIQAMANRGAFSNFRGGELEWIEKHTGTV
ncbi:HipA family kinase [Paenibacillus macerans]|uniref:HipA family kinase n=1 Tax=Paenibacillus macerans TaxID=44252 RepID=UPI003D31C740